MVPKEKGKGSNLKSFLVSHSFSPPTKKSTKPLGIIKRFLPCHFFAKDTKVQTRKSAFFKLKYFHFQNHGATANSSPRNKSTFAWPPPGQDLLFCLDIYLPVLGWPHFTYVVLLRLRLGRGASYENYGHSKSWTWLQISCNNTNIQNGNNNKQLTRGLPEFIYMDTGSNSIKSTSSLSENPPK